MMTFPTWWLVLSGISFTLLILFVLFLIAVVFQLSRHIRELAAKVSVLADRSQRILDHGEGIAIQVHKTLREIGEPTANIVHRIDETTARISQVIERGSLLIFGIVAIKRLLSMLRNRDKESKSETTTQQKEEG
jgi:predicted PurR-regulated permease PerM